MKTQKRPSLFGVNIASSNCLRPSAEIVQGRRVGGGGGGECTQIWKGRRCSSSCLGVYITDFSLTRSVHDKTPNILSRQGPVYVSQSNVIPFWRSRVRPIKKKLEERPDWSPLDGEFNLKFPTNILARDPSSSVS